jgi:sugar-specific transcriptional regulator TrmB
MSGDSNKARAVGLLQELGLKEYEAKSFVALTRRESGTAREISDTSEVPRTRVCDAIGVLESKGLVETQHTNPQVFRAVPIEEAVETLKREYVDRTASLHSVLNRLDSADDTERTDSTNEVWALSGTQAITSRTAQLIEEATDEVFLFVGHEAVVTDRLARQLQSAHDRDVEVSISTVDESVETRVQRAVACGRVFVSSLDWVDDPPMSDGDTQISRLMLADREAIVVSSITGSAPHERAHERGVVGRGVDNGVVAIVRRLVASGLLAPDAASDRDR